jgi:hypothetical protein
VSFGSEQVRQCFLPSEWRMQQEELYAWPSSFRETGDVAGSHQACLVCCVPIGEKNFTLIQAPAAPLLYYAGPSMKNQRNATYSQCDPPRTYACLERDPSQAVDAVRVDRIAGEHAGTHNSHEG